MHKLLFYSNCYRTFWQNWMENGHFLYDKKMLLRILDISNLKKDLQPIFPITVYNVQGMTLITANELRIKIYSNPINQKQKSCRKKIKYKLKPKLRIGL